MELTFKLMVFTVGIIPILAFPQLKTDSSLLVTPGFVRTGTTITQVPQSDAPHTEQSVDKKKPEIYELNISSNITNRFAQNLIFSRVRNPEDIAQETVFSVILPETAFITGFTMEIDGKNYTAYIKEKEEAKQVYDQAVASGISAAHVAATARDSSRFTVNVNVEPQGKVVFYLTYEELLKRKEAQYEMVINIHPKQPVPKLNVEVTINEQKPLKFVRTPNLRSGNEITKNSDDLNPESHINKYNDTTAVVTFSPSLEKQSKLAETLGSDKEYGFSGQFVVQYDVERDSSGGQILLNDGYFVHFFAPNEIKPLPKYVVFVLDTSGSMYDEKLNQLKQAMKSIMGDLKPSDKFNVVEFSTFVNVWDINKADTSVSYPTDRSVQWYQGKSNESVQEVKFPAAVSVNPDSVKMTIDRISEMTSDGGTNIYEALKVALWLVESEKIKNPEGHQPMIIFLTDGDATVGVTNQNEIIKDTTDFNKYKTPIFSLSFGAGADRILLEKMSLQNSAFARHIYEGSDASLQLEDFYKTISSPLLRDVEFKYTPQAEAITKNKFPILFGGGEFIVAGKLSDQEFSENPKVLAHGIAGPIELKPEIINPVSSMERLWAYLTTQQFLEAAKSQNKTLNEKKALDIALKYSFVTSVSSLVVVKPNDTVSSIDTEKADTAKSYGNRLSSARLSGSPKYALHARTNYNAYIRGGSTSNSLSSARLSLGRPKYADHARTNFNSYIRGGSTNNAGQYNLLSSPMRGGYSAATATGPIGIRYSGADESDTFDSDSDGLPPPQIHPTTTYTHAYHSTRMHQSSTTPRSPLNTLKSDLPWITALLTDDGESITLKTGVYKLGLFDTTPTPKIDCPKTLNNATGTCSLLHECRPVYSLLTSTETYEEYFCKINQFAGVCCP